MGACSLGGCLACLYQLPCQAKQIGKQPLHCTLHPHCTESRFPWRYRLAVRLS